MGSHAYDKTKEHTNTTHLVDRALLTLSPTKSTSFMKMGLSDIHNPKEDYNNVGYLRF